MNVESASSRCLNTAQAREISSTPAMMDGSKLSENMLDSFSSKGGYVVQEEETWPDMKEWELAFVSLLK